MKWRDIVAFFRKKRYWHKVNNYGEDVRSISHEAEQALQVIDRLQGLEQEGLLVRDGSSGKVFIASVLTIPYLTHEQHWRNFVNNIRLWAQYTESADEWERIFREAEREAVRKLKENHPSYTPNELYEVRRKARMDIPLDAIPTPEPKELEFVICSSLTDPEQAEIIAVGRWDGTDMDFVSFTHVREALTE